VRAHRDIIWTPLMSADGRLMGSASVDRTVRLWRLPGLKPVGAALHFSILPQDAVVSPDGTLLAVPRQDGLVDVFRTTRDLRRIARFRADRNWVVLGRFAPDGRTFVTGGVDGVVRFWTVPSWKPAGRPLAAHTGYVYSLGFDRAGERLITGGLDGKVRLWDVATRTPIGTSLPGFENTPVQAAFAAGDSRVVAMDPTRGLRWDIRTAAWARQACRVAGRRLSRAEWAEFLPERDYAPAC
jgi:WD40 repeat protein